jgi:hypothetical protein
VADELDDSSILDEAVLWRRIASDWYIREPSGTRLSSAAFANGPNVDAFSICVAADAETLGHSIQQFAKNDLQARPCGVAGLTAGLVRSESQAVYRCDEPPQVAHGHVHGEKKKSLRRRLARAATRLLELDEDTTAQ